MTRDMNIIPRSFFIVRQQDRVLEIIRDEMSRGQLVEDEMGWDGMGCDRRAEESRGENRGEKQVNFSSSGG